MEQTDTMDTKILSIFLRNKLDVRVKKIGSEITIEGPHVWVNLTRDNQAWFSVYKDIEGESRTVFNAEYDLNKDEEKLLTDIDRLSHLLVQGKLYLYFEKYSHVFGLFRGAYTAGFINQDSQYKILPGSHMWHSKDSFHQNELNSLRGKLIKV